MDKLFLLNLFTFLCLAEGRFLTRQEADKNCNLCTVFHMGFCYTGMKSCAASAGDHCATKNIYVIQNTGEARYHYSKLTCKSNCVNEDMTSKRKRVEILCCREQHYCNMPFGSKIPAS
ncbi:prostate and testis expressed protein 2 isoform X1 [Sarcophilus harrisii]|uniref:UPAR/Ly6 domain-containing protein n=1 Tax=Sarcophilus harrisii TaxID=9305 RepID=A0A7N4PWP6_SARHA|nr:prostate and testis expressed protein 2 isoform X1 [Sarcophilus harrisii]